MDSPVFVATQQYIRPIDGSCCKIFDSSIMRKMFPLSQNSWNVENRVEIREKQKNEYSLPIF